MKIEIWSDVMCPFCYIGKRRLEKAIAQFPHKDAIQIEWKSFQLNPAMKTDPSKNINEYLAEIKGWSVEQAIEANEQVTEMAAEEGLHYDFGKAIVANSFDAHRLIQFAKEHGKGDAIEESLFRSYFTEGKNTADHDILATLASEAGLDADAVKEMLKGKEYGDKVRQNILEAQHIGIRGVPFFVLDSKYAVSGAQPVNTFVMALEKAWNDAGVQA